MKNPKSLYIFNNNNGIKDMSAFQSKFNQIQDIL